MIQKFKVEQNIPKNCPKNAYTYMFSYVFRVKYDKYALTNWAHFNENFMNRGDTQNSLSPMHTKNMLEHKNPSPGYDTFNIGRGT